MLMSLYDRDIFMKEHGFSLVEINPMTMADASAYEAMIMTKMAEQAKQRN